jgi:acyl-CoA synthetase (AMP-forming)/AMP-acid ligase II
MSTLVFLILSLILGNYDSVRPSTAPGSGNVGTLMDSQVVKNHLKRAVHVADQESARWTYGELKVNTNQHWHSCYSRADFHKLFFFADFVVVVVVVQRHVDAFALGLLNLNFSSGSRIALALPNNGEFVSPFPFLAKTFLVCHLVFFI